jgi:glycosyltransferase involved in cell wall biosynthesis
MNPDISVVIPVRNEASTCRRGRRAHGNARELRPPLRIIVDDGMPDETFECLAALQVRDARLRIIRFRRNFDRPPALLPVSRTHADASSDF